jgi:hypothetical protein
MAYSIRKNSLSCQNEGSERMREKFPCVSLSMKANLINSSKYANRIKIGKID